MLTRTLTSPNPEIGPTGAGSAGNGILVQQLLLSNILSSLSFGIQNCNSLNVSTSCPKQLKKIKAIIDLNCDIVFLSDLRLNKNPGVTDIEKSFLAGSSKKHKFYFNSTMNSRGTGILISSNIDYNVNYVFNDELENILAMNISMSGQSVNLISVYGPNLDNPIFFRDLNRFFNLYPDCPTIIGGDWNATYSTDPTPQNIDIFRMQGPPSIFRSEGIADLCTTYSLSDPFRILHPDMRDFTFRPKTRQVNRSRLDYFLISDTLIDCLSSCEINLALATELFDHKSVRLDLNKIEFVPNRSINLTTLTHPRLKETILAAAADCYLAHCAPEQLVDLEACRAQTGRYFSILRDINDLEFNIELNRNE